MDVASDLLFVDGNIQTGLARFLAFIVFDLESKSAEKGNLTLKAVI